VSGGREPVEFPDCVADRETPLAVRVHIPGFDPVWIPKSQILDASEVYEDGHRGTLVIPEWLATEKGLV